MSNAARLLIVGIILAACCRCENPFWPSTGTPVGATGLLRATAQGVLDQLIRSYSTRRIELFEEILQPSSARDSAGFRFYVAPSFAAEKASLGQQLPGEAIGSDIFANIPQGIYYYWNRDSEIRRHQVLFSKSAEITFTVPPRTTDIIYTTRVIAETLFVEDNQTRFVSERRDTTAVEIVMEGGTVTIWAPSLSDQQLPKFDIGKQVFYLVRDPRDPALWVISRWFDFDRF